MRTPTPWTVSGSLIVGADNYTVVARVTHSGNLVRPKNPPSDYDASSPQWTGGAEQNAELIVRAVNERTGLRAALADLVDQLDGIGIPEWHGAEGLDLTAARAVLDPRQGGTA